VDGLENFLLSEVSQGQKKSKVTCFLSYVEASLKIKCLYINIYGHICSDRKNKIVLLDLSEGTIGGRTEEDNVRE
jgi:hypothetical protein